MTINEALTLTKGSYVCSRYTMPPLRPIRVTDIWINRLETIVRIRAASVSDDPQQWLDATGYELPPKGHKWDKIKSEWVSAAEMARRAKDRRA